MSFFLNSIATKYRKIMHNKKCSVEHCFRCMGKLQLMDEDVKSSVSFYQCTNCQSHYTLTANKKLHDRWLMPITLVLYGVIFDNNPALRAVTVAQEFYHRDDIDLEKMITDIEQELEAPRQNLVDIFEFSYPNEAKLRVFLRQFIVELKRIKAHARS
jgi:hypothetical protein